MCLCDTCRCSKALKIQVFAIFTDFESKSSVFNYSKSERNICFLATIWRNSRYERPRIHFHPGPQVRHARRAVHCLKSVKTGNCLRAGGAFFWTVLFAAGQYYLPRFVRGMLSHGLLSCGLKVRTIGLSHGLNRGLF